MRALLDTNLLIGILLSSNPSASAIGAIILAALDGRFTLLLTAGVTDEFDRKPRERPDLAAKISRGQADALLATLATVAEAIPALPGPYPEIGGDRKDDFLFAHAKAGGADYLVTWDKGLRNLRRVGGVAIVSPAEFLRILRDAGLL